MKRWMFLTFISCILVVTLGRGYGQSPGANNTTSALMPLVPRILGSNNSTREMPVSQGSYKYRGIPEAEDAIALAALRRAGLSRDRSQVPSLIAALRAPNHPTYPYVALHSLAQLGATEALPAFSDYVSDTGAFSSDADLRNFALVSRARLLAESSCVNISDSKEQAKTKVRRFYQELGITAADINSRPLTQVSSPLAQGAQGGGFFASSVPPIHTVTSQVLRELSDMVYQDQYQDFSTLPEVTQVDFSREPSCALKMRFAPLSHQERIAALVQELSRKTVLKAGDLYEIQLAINEGLSGSQAAAAELRKMDTHREQYNQIGYHSGFSALFDVISGVGDKDQAPLIEHFTHDKDSWVAHYASIAYNNVRSGIPRQPICGY